MRDISVLAILGWMLLLGGSCVLLGTSEADYIAEMADGGTDGGADAH